MKKNLHLLGTLFLLFAVTCTGFAQTVFINEIHYDNVSTDQGEAIEVAGPEGTDLTGWSIVLYNGSNGTAYNTISLSGLIPNQNNGFGTVASFLPSNGLQNGAPDGIALVDASANVVQFLSYEGSFSASNGVASGMTSIDIGIAETSSTVVGNSLQLSGSGTTYTDFIWEAASNTFGAININQVLGTPQSQIIINEIDADTEGSDALEFVELYDGGIGNTALDGYVLVFFNGSSDVSYAAYDLDGYTTSAEGYFVLGNAGVDNVNIVFSSNGLQNGADAVALYKADASDFPNGTPISTEMLEDAIVYDTNDGDDTGLLPLLNAGQPQVNEGGAGDKDAHSLQRIPNGTGGLRNTTTYTQLIPTPGAENSIPVEPAVIVINEIDADTEGTDVLEFVELYDGGEGNTPLDGYVVVFFNGSDDASYQAYDLDGYATDANGYFVLGNTGVNNVDLVFGSNGLQNGADAVALYLADGTDFPNDTPVSTANLLDAIVYDTNDGDDAGLLTLLNTDEPQVNEGGAGEKDAHSLQRFPNGEGGLRNTTSYTQAIPTPGAPNSNATAPITLVINEVDADTEGTDVLEFVEIYDGGIGNTPLDGFVVVFYNGSDDASYAAYDLDGFSSNADGYFVLGNEGVSNVNLVFNSNGLQNGADAVAIHQANAADFSNDTPINTTNLIDAIVYDTDDADDAGLLVLLNAGQEQVNENQNGEKTSQSLQRIPNGSGGARNTNTYATLIPTPGAENIEEVVPVEPITILEARNATPGTVVMVSGILTVSDQFAGAAFLQDATAGIAVYDWQVHGAGLFNIGDSITITGTRAAYNDMIQITTLSEVISHGAAVKTIEPVEITLTEISEHPGELVKISGVSFPAPDDLLFGNTNYVVSDVSGVASMRLDGDVRDLVGLAQPEACEITGVVGRFLDIFQLMPRIFQDLPCAEEFSAEDGLGIAKELTLDVVTWNIEWFGDEGNSPAGADADLTQKDSVKSVIEALNADIIGVEEIADDALLAQMVSEIPGYDFILSDATSYPGGSGVKQKVGFIYKTSTVSPVSSKVLLAAAHPYYNGGDESMLADYPDADKTRFFASGRLPFMLTADVTINGATERISFIDLHARANRSSDAQARYDMRRYDVEALKDTLDTYYADANIVLLGDYNDDVDETVANVNTSESSFKAYVDDVANYSVVSSVLSDANYRSYVFYPNMIDHIMLTNELSSRYINGSARVHYEFYSSEYTKTTSDHFPVSARLQLKNLELVAISGSNIDCNGGDNGTATIEVSGGIEPYTYFWSDGQTTATATGLTAQTYSVTVTDKLGAELIASITIEEPAPVEIDLSNNAVIYPAYPDSACTTISVLDVWGGSGTCSYLWSTGETTETIHVCPTEETEYWVEVMDENNCMASGTVVVIPVDILCSNNNKGRPKLQICYHGKTKCVAINAVDELIRNGAKLGACSVDDQVVTLSELENFVVYPNPFKSKATVAFTSKTKTEGTISVYSEGGVNVFSEAIKIHKGYNINKLKLSSLISGTYILTISGNEIQPISKVIIKQ